MGSVATDNTTDPPDTRHPRSTGESCQGRHTLGAAPDGLTDQLSGQTFVSFGTRASDRLGVPVWVSVVGGNLVAKTSLGVPLYSGTSTGFMGMRLKTPIGIEVEITGTSTQSYGAGYTLRYVASGADYCGTAGGAAVPLQGVIESDRFHVVGPNVSFGCDDGVYKKCEGWGYVPGNDPTSAGWRFHQACMRMANADVYGNGEIYTREETPIVIRDIMVGAKPRPDDAPALSNPTTLPASPDIAFFEGAWSAGRGQGAVCLAKRRWNSLPLDNPPHTSLLDPRTVDDPNVQFCDDLHIEDMVSKGALLFNASKRMDLVMNRWRNPSNGDVVSTVRGYPNNIAARRELPFDGYTDFIATDGIVLRNLTGTLTDPEDVTALYLQHNAATDDYVVATATSVAPGYAIDDPVADFEGYALNDPGGADLVPLRLFVKPTVDGYDYVSSIYDLTPEYQFVMQLHYVMRYTNGVPISGAGFEGGGGLRTTVCQSPQ